MSRAIKPFAYRCERGDPPSKQFFRQWIATLLAVSEYSNTVLHFINLSKSGRHAISAHDQAMRALICATWIGAHPTGLACKPAQIWLRYVFGVSRRAVLRWARPLLKTPLPVQLAERAQAIAPWVDEAVESAAIEAGWIDHETHSTTPWRAEAHLLQVALRLAREAHREGLIPPNATALSPHRRNA